METAWQKHRDKYKDCPIRKAKIKASNAKWAANNRDKMNKSQREWTKRNRDKVNAYKRLQRERDKLDPLKVMKRRLRNRTVKAFNVSKWNKNSKNIDMLGCTWEDAFEHLSSKFTEGMTWDNRDKWHIDHTIPLASAQCEEELIKLCHYTNLQPLWAEDNLRKGDSMPS